MATFYIIGNTYQKSNRIYTYYNMYSRIKKHIYRYLLKI